MHTQDADAMVQLYSNEIQDVYQVSEKLYDVAIGERNGTVKTLNDPIGLDVMAQGKQHILAGFCQKGLFCLSVHLIVPQFISFLFIHVLVCSSRLSACLPVCLSFCPSVSIHLSIYPSVYPFLFFPTHDHVHTPLLAHHSYMLPVCTCMYKL